MKGVKCVECGNVFKARDSRAEDKLPWNKCYCPRCKTPLEIVFPKKEMAIIVIASLAGLSVLLYSIVNFSTDVTFPLLLLLAFVAVLGGRIIDKMCLLTVRATEDK
jgi:phage FluMu protein Com